MEFLTQLSEFIPNCPICYNPTFDYIVVCNNNHYICSKCFTIIEKKSETKCPICRQQIIYNKLSSWITEFSDNLKSYLLQNIDLQHNQKIDFFDNDDKWKHGIIKDIDLANKCILIESEYYNIDEYIKIPLYQNHKIQKFLTKTINWRNPEYLNNIQNINTLLCKEKYEEENICNDFLCAHTKIWIASKIVYICNNSNHLLLVFNYPNNIADSVWVSFDSKFICLP
jgi:DNA-directed RNA polymerase subunit RPC12/RpoP